MPPVTEEVASIVTSKFALRPINQTIIKTINILVGYFYATPKKS